MSLRWYPVVIDCHAVAAQARWWAAVLDWQIIHGPTMRLSWCPDTQ